MSQRDWRNVTAPIVRTDIYAQRPTDVPRPSVPGGRAFANFVRLFDNVMGMLGGPPAGVIHNVPLSGATGQMPYSNVRVANPQSPLTWGGATGWMPGNAVQSGNRAIVVPLAGMDY